MDTAEDPSRVLPSARSLMLHVQDHPSSTQHETTDKMQIDTEGMYTQHRWREGSKTVIAHMGWLLLLLS